MPALRLIYRSRVSSRQSSDCILHPSRQPCVNCVKLINTNLITRYNRFIFNSCTSTLISSQDTICSYSIRVLPFPFFFLLSPSHLPDGGCTAIILHWLHKFQLVHVCHYNFTLHVSVGCHMSSISSSHNWASSYHLAFGPTVLKASTMTSVLNAISLFFLCHVSLSLSFVSGQLGALPFNYHG
jgi:hypothetical protein